MIDEATEKAYNAFMVNRGLSYFPDTVRIANEMYMEAHLDNKLQYRFLINIIRKRKRYSKWHKASVEKDVEVVKEYYGYSNEKARQAVKLLSPEQVSTLKEKIYKGGRK